MIDAFRMADNVLVNAVKGISDIINVPGNLNVDFADVKTVMSSMGQALMGIGIGEGANRAKDAAQRAISSPLLEDVSIEGATGILINITANESLGIREVNEACSLIQEAAHEDAHIIFGTVIDESVGDQIRVTVIATGFPHLDRDSRQANTTSSLSRQNLSKRPMTPQKAPPYQAPQHHVQQPQHFTPRPHQNDSRSFRESPERSYEENLAKMTMGGLPGREQPQQQQAPHYQAQPAPQSQYEQRNPYGEPQVGQHGSPAQRIGASSAPVNLDDEDLAAIAPQHVREPQPQTQVQGARAGESEPANDEMDRKIDEALKIAEQLSKSPAQNEDDDLDIPSFLRKSNKDLSLS